MKYFFSIILLFIPFCIFSQTDSISSVHVDSISPKNMEDSESLLELLSDIRYNQDREYESNRYKIYPTEVVVELFLKKNSKSLNFHKLRLFYVHKVL